MGTMPRVLALLALAIVSAVAIACGGGDGNSGNGPNLNPKLTDPAGVPTSTPIDGQLVYQIRDGVPSAPDGAVATPSTGDGGGGGSAQGYTVVGGDTCGSIADKLGVATPELLVANPSINDGCTNLQPGQVLAIPGGGSSGGGGSTNPTPTASASGNVHTVGAGDTCFDIALNWGVSTDAIIAANPGLDCGALQPGQLIQIP